jgi:hypothetical protein
MSPTALTWAFASSVAKSSGYMLTSANVIMVSGHCRGFLYRRTITGLVFSQVRVQISTQSYSNFGLAEGDRTGRMFAPAVYRKVTLTGQAGSLRVQAGQLLGGYCRSRHVR